MLLFRGREAHSRSFAKATSWRILGSIDTFLLSWFFTGSPQAAGAIATSEVLTKLVLYYLYERGWAQIRWGMHADQHSSINKSSPPAEAAEC